MKSHSPQTPPEWGRGQSSFPRWQTVTKQVFIYHAKHTEKMMHTFTVENWHVTDSPSSLGDLVKSPPTPATCPRRHHHLPPSCHAMMGFRVYLSGKGYA